MTRRPKGTEKSQLFGKTVQVCVTEEELHALNSIRTRQGRSRSEVIREVLSPILDIEIREQKQKQRAEKRAANGENPIEEEPITGEIS